MADRPAGPSVLGALDYVYGRVRGRLDGLTQAEYGWEPVPYCWTVRKRTNGRYTVDRVVPDPDPAPVTTIAWRLWHLADCFADYTAKGLGDWPLATRGREWHSEVEPALAALDQAWQAFRAGLDALGEDGLWRPLGEEWGPYREQPWIELALHAMDELAHHGAELALLRDLYRAGGHAHQN